MTSATRTCFWLHLTAALLIADGVYDGKRKRRENMLSVMLSWLAANPDWAADVPRKQANQLRVAMKQIFIRLGNDDPLRSRVAQFIFN